ncbi:SH3 domain-containing protein [Blyttiomyces helicus]|uniref:SH3 domain-containing protein n=1 Tax=Blyttiomyces helicus TaxID=388810 RepID=A0A4P9W9T1_9FUNG|nr:SH3 domain-containing protein [Blyttiomyces helicus]|eukprot:RKO87580.1 SH3 domain-containing protein [Blyttiomyces helicus]
MFSKDKDKFKDDGSGLSTAERIYRHYLIDQIIDDLNVMQKHNFLPAPAFGEAPSRCRLVSFGCIGEGSVDTVVQQLSFEKTNPVAAREGQNAAGSAVGVPIAHIEEDPSVMQLGPFRLKKAGAESSGGGGATPILKQVVAVSDFGPGEPGDLEFRVGDVIDIIQDVDANWYRGRLHGQEGILPKTYVEARGAPPPPQRN